MPKPAQLIIVIYLSINLVFCSNYYQQPSNYQQRPGRGYGGSNSRPAPTRQPHTPRNILAEFPPEFQWDQIDYEDAPNQGYTTQSRSVHDDYTKYNNVPMGTTRYGDRVLITMPRRRTGIPATLSYVTKPESSYGKTVMDANLRPFPNLEVNSFQQGNNITGFQLVSVYRTRVDECNRLWMVDTGLLEYPDNPIQVQPAAIVILDSSGQLVHRYELPAEVVRANSTLALIEPDLPNPNNCDEAYGYIPDLSSFAVIVYDLKNQRSWRVADDAFRNEEENGDFLLNNDLSYHWSDGIFSISLGPRDNSGYRIGYFHPMAGTHEYTVNTRFLRQPSASRRRVTDIVHLGNKGTRQQTSIGALDPGTGVLFYSLVNDNGIACWNTRKEFSPQNHVVLLTDNSQFVYPSDMTVDGQGNIYVMTNTMPYFLYRSLNPQDINYRVWRFNVRELIKNTNCAN